MSSTSLDYRHNTPPSSQSRIIQTVMGLFGMKRMIARKMITNGFKKAPARIPKSLLRNLIVQEVSQNNRSVWTISPGEGRSDVVILFLHGGAYMGNITKQHWDLVEQLIRHTNATIVMPDYPLAPEATCVETYAFMQVLYDGLMRDHPTNRTIFMGDSAGGGLALGFVQQLRDEHKQQPDAVILLSPWLDLTMRNPDLQLLDKGDVMLSIDGLKSAAQKYAGSLDLQDYRVSPVYGDLIGLCRISIFTGTRDLLNADARKFKQHMKDLHISFNYFEYPKLFHDWVIIKSLKESRDVIKKVGELLKDKH